MTMRCHGRGHTGADLYVCVCHLLGTRALMSLLFAVQVEMVHGRSNSTVRPDLRLNSRVLPRQLQQAGATDATSTSAVVLIGRRPVSCTTELRTTLPSNHQRESF